MNSLSLCSHCYPTCPKTMDSLGTSWKKSPNRWVLLITSFLIQFNFLWHSYITLLTRGAPWTTVDSYFTLLTRGAPWTTVDHSIKWRSQNWNRSVYKKSVHQERTGIWFFMSGRQKPSLPAQAYNCCQMNKSSDHTVSRFPSWLPWPSFVKTVADWERDKKFIWEWLAPTQNLSAAVIGMLSMAHSRLDLCSQTGR
jgi:hypothetical protein